MIFFFNSKDQPNSLIYIEVNLIVSIGVLISYNDSFFLS